MGRSYIRLAPPGLDPAPAPLGPLTYYGVGGGCRWYAEANTVETLIDLRSWADARSVPVLMLGSGANTLVTDAGVDALVIRLGGDFARIDIIDDVMIAGAAAPLGGAIARTLKLGWSGLEMMAGVPASIGGAAICNAGGRAGDIGQLIRHCEVLGPGGEIRRIQAAEAGFAYRCSALAGEIVTRVCLAFEFAPPEELRAAYLRALSAKKVSQPLNAASAGCVFRNARGLSASKLIARSGLCGRRRGSAAVSELHGNFITVDPGGSADDILALAAIVRDVVARKQNVVLELEVRVWGDSPHLTELA